MIRVLLLGLACITCIVVRASSPIVPSVWSFWWWVWIIATVGFAWLWGWMSARLYEHRKRMHSRHEP